MSKDKTKEETALVPTDSMDNLPAEVQEMYAEDSKENLENINDGFHKLSISGSRFKINGEPAGREGIEFSGVVLRELPVNTFYKGKYDPDNVDLPDCFSVGGMNPDSSVKEPCSTSCVGCPNNEWDTGTNAKGEPSGKACSNSRRIIIVVEGVPLPIMMSVPPSALGNFNDFLKLLASKKLPLAAVVTKITFDPNSDFPKPIFDVVSLLDTETYKEMRTLRKSEAIEKVLYSFSTGEKSESSSESAEVSGNDSM